MASLAGAVYTAISIGYGKQSTLPNLAATMLTLSISAAVYALQRLIYLDDFLYTLRLKGHYQAIILSLLDLLIKIGTDWLILLVNVLMRPLHPGFQFRPLFAQI